MKSLANFTDRASILSRVSSVRPDSPRRWGKMTSHQMLCHLGDSFRSGMGELYASPATGLLQRTLIKWIALGTSFPWPHGVPTRPEMNQHMGGTRPVDFEADRAALARSIEQFSASGAPRGKHPIFGAMTDEEWLRWGYLHADHHLRQFSS